MFLHTKYLTGFAILVVLSISYFMLMPGSPSSIKGIISIVIGSSIFVIGSIFYTFLYSSERIKGFQAEYEISPDLTEFKAIPFSEKDSLAQDEEIPTEAFCGKCGKKVFKPFKCSVCKQILCGKHYLLGEHQCRERQL